MPMKRQKPANILIVEDDRAYAENVIARHFVDDWRVRMARTVPDALQAAAEIVDLRLAIVDLDIPGGTEDLRAPGGSGFQVIAALRQRFPGARVVVLTGHLTPALVNKAQAMGAEYLAKGGCIENLKAIANALREADLSEGAPVLRATRKLAVSAGLTEKQSEVLLLAARNFSRDEIAQELGITDWTLKSHVREILRRTKYARLQPLLRFIARTAEAD